VRVWRERIIFAFNQQSPGQFDRGFACIVYLVFG